MSKVKQSNSQKSLDPENVFYRLKHLPGDLAQINKVPAESKDFRLFDL